MRLLDLSRMRQPLISALGILVTILSYPLHGFVFGVYPSDEPEVIYRAFLPLAGYLSEQTGEPVDLVVAADYDDLYERIADGRVDVAWINPAGYIRLTAALSDLQYITTFRQSSPDGGQDTSYYRSLVITPVDGAL